MNSLIGLAEKEWHETRRAPMSAAEADAEAAAYAAVPLPRAALTSPPPAEKRWTMDELQHAAKALQHHADVHAAQQNQ
jgi:hypothetical protein